jgi:hypothetical protein
MVVGVAGLAFRFERWSELTVVDLCRKSAGSAALTAATSVVGLQHLMHSQQQVLSGVHFSATNHWVVAPATATGQPEGCLRQNMDAINVLRLLVFFITFLGELFKVPRSYRIDGWVSFSR